MENKAAIEIDARLENLPKIIDFVSSWMHDMKLDAILFAVQTSIDEACTNIIKHAYSSKGGLMSVSCELHDEYCVVTIVDRGKAYDHNNASKPDLNADLENRKIGGLGMHLMKNLMDDVTYRYDNSKGNVLVMKKKITGRL